MDLGVAVHSFGDNEGRLAHGPVPGDSLSGDDESLGRRVRPLVAVLESSGAPVMTPEAKGR